MADHSASLGTPPSVHRFLQEVGTMDVCFLGDLLGSMRSAPILPAGLAPRLYGQTPPALATIGMVMLLGGGILQALTVRILGFAGITGGHELDNRQDVFRSSGVFGAVRHPTYLAHTIILLGIFFITRNAAVGIVALLDFLVAYFVIIPLEERELLKRFGPAFDEYRQNTPRFFPRIRL